MFYKLRGTIVGVSSLGRQMHRVYFWWRVVFVWWMWNKWILLGTQVLTLPTLFSLPKYAYRWKVLKLDKESHRLATPKTRNRETYKYLSLDCNLSVQAINIKTKRFFFEAFEDIIQVILGQGLCKRHFETIRWAFRVNNIGIENAETFKRTNFWQIRTTPANKTSNMVPLVAYMPVAQVTWSPLSPNPLRLRRVTADGRIGFPIHTAHPSRA